MPDWSHTNPVFLDFETQSHCDLKETGGRAYALHSSTRILILVMCIDDVFHVWIPDYIRTRTQDWDIRQLWPYQLQPRKEVRLYRGESPPANMVTLCASNSNVPFVAHNAYGFDRYIWNRFLPHHSEWLDSLYLAKQSGRNGKLDSLAKAILGVGKDHAKKLLKKLTTGYPVIATGDLLAFTRYAVADVEILRRLWTEFDSIKVESDVIEVHDKINQRGIRADMVLLDAIERVSLYSVGEACKDIEVLTDNKLNADNLRSGKQVHEWLNGWGVQLVDDKGKPCLRKEIVQRFIDSPFIIEDNLIAARTVPKHVLDVLQLRMKALRITDAKVSRAKSRAAKVEHEHYRIYDLLAYHNAHTGRWSSYGVNIHNLPRPHKLFDDKDYPAFRIENILNSVNFAEPDTRKLFDRIKSFVPYKDGKPLCTIDDITSALIRPCLLASPGHIFCIADYAQVEARGAAKLAKEMKMLSAFAEGRDIYREFAAMMFGVPLEEVTKNQRQIAKSAVLGCIYGLAETKFNVYAANNQANLDDAGVTAGFVVESFRNTYTNIAGWKPKRGDSFRVGGLWKDYDKAVKDAVRTRVPQFVAYCRFHMQGRDLLITLPSGRELYYPNARIEDIIPPYCFAPGFTGNIAPKATVVYDSERGQKSLYGGLITENIVQAMCRDMLATALIELQLAGLRVVAHIHDEIIVECLIGQETETLRKMVEIMSRVPRWIDGFPLVVEGYTCPRFNKSPFEKAYKTDTRKLLAV